MKRMKQLGRAILLMLCFVMLFSACQWGSSPADTTGGSGSDIVTDPPSNEEPQEKGDPRLLYNGIYLPEEWPPKDVSKNFNEEIEAPYLTDISDGGTHPDVVNIDVGRQLFVDDFLIESTSLTSTYHYAEIYDGNPIFKALSHDETNADTFGKALEKGFHLKHGGIWYDEEKHLFEMWYNLGNGVGYASSTDGINWTDKGRIFAFKGNGGGYATVIKDENADKDAPKFWMLVRRSNGYFDPNDEDDTHEFYATEIYYSYDGQTWRLKGAGPTSGDASTLIYNPFRDVWQFSLRRSYKASKTVPVKLGRARDYLELENLLDLSRISEDDVVFWTRADSSDLRDPILNFKPEIYSLCAVGYESIMLGSFQMLKGPENNEMIKTGIPKVTDLVLGYSRDGFYYTRPDRNSFIESSQVAGTWDRGYLHQVSSVCLIVGDELWFYYGGYEGDQSFAGDSSKTGGAMNKFSIGLAKLRRDGFVSLDGTGEVLTRKMTVTQGQKYLFINAVADSVKAEVLDENGNVIEGFSMAECTPFSGDSTCSMLKWGNKDLSALSGTTFQIRFSVKKGSFYSFWLSATQDGASNGATAGGVVV